MLPWVCIPGISTYAAPAPDCGAELVGEAAAKTLVVLVVNRVLRKSIEVHCCPAGRLNQGGVAMYKRRKNQKNQALCHFNPSFNALHTVLAKCQWR